MARHQVRQHVLVSLSTLFLKNRKLGIDWLYANKSQVQTQANTLSTDYSAPKIGIFTTVIVIYVLDCTNLRVANQLPA